MRNWLSVAIVIPVCLMVSLQVTTAQDIPGGTLEQDRQGLEGLWRTEGWRKETAEGWQCQADVSLEGSKSPSFSLTINFERAVKPSSGPVLGLLQLE